MAPEGSTGLSTLVFGRRTELTLVACQSRPAAALTVFHETNTRGEDTFDSGLRHGLFTDCTFMLSVVRLDKTI